MILPSQRWYSQFTQHFSSCRAHVRSIHFPSFHISHLQICKGEMPTTGERVRLRSFLSYNCVCMSWSRSTDFLQVPLLSWVLFIFKANREKRIERKETFFRVQCLHYIEWSFVHSSHRWSLSLMLFCCMISCIQQKLNGKQWQRWERGRGEEMVQKAMHFYWLY